MGGPNNSSKEIEGLRFKVKYKDLCVASPGLKIPKGIIITGSLEFQNVIKNTFEELVNIGHGRSLINQIFNLLNENEIIIYEDRITKVHQANPYLISFNINETNHDANNGLGNNGLIRKNITTLAHELEHIRQRLLKLPNMKIFCADQNPKPNIYIPVVEYCEILAVEVENMIRKELKVPLRTHYNGVNVFSKKLSKKYAPMRYDEKKGKCELLTSSSDLFNSEIIRLNVNILETAISPNVQLGNNHSLNLRYTPSILLYSKIPKTPKHTPVMIISIVL